LFIDDKKIFIKKDSKETNNMITLKFNERDGHYLYITNRRCEILKKNLQNVKVIEVGKHKINISDFEFIDLPKSSYTKINCIKIKEISNELVIQKTKLAKKIKEKFKLEIRYILDQFSYLFLYWSKKIGYIDFINSGAKVAIKNHYSKPIIKKTDDSYFNCVNLRHPIVENISTDSEYKPHSLELGGNNELCGILLYGINSSGKSTLMKSIGLNIILAQIGYFVAADNFIFSPYYSLFTRISGNDNIYRGQSSFMVEMIELTSILKRYNSNTIVLADEVCRGTEEKSANIIVAYMLETLSLNKTTFITATHLHKLTNLPTIKNIKNIKSKHLKVTYDNLNDNLIYDRELIDGQGETFYGLTVAKYLMKDNKFNEITLRILNEYENEPKQSKYNSKNFLIECKICKCKDNLETHHIEFQKDFDLNDIHKDKLHYQKDANYNLVTLCRFCHDEVDRNKIIINGWTETINGPELDYYKKEPSKIIKYSDLDNYKSIDKLLKINDYKIILIESQQNAGHWVVILKYKKDNKIIIEYFNSYGMKPEADLSYVGSAMNKILENDKGNLKELLNDAISKGYEVIYNKKRFQSSNKKVNTCGRWIILRIIMMKHYKMSLEEFSSFIEQLKKKYKTEADIICAMLTP